MSKNVFEAIRQWRLIQGVEHDGIDETAKDEDIPKSEVNELVLKAIQDHQDVIKSHQHSIASLQKCIQEEGKKNPKMEPKSSASSSSQGGDVLCYICGKNDHKAKECWLL
ncbi:DNA-binding protein HEXBP [Tanacetum coccineum]